MEKILKKEHTNVFIREYEDGSLDIGYYEEVSPQYIEPVILQTIKKADELDLV